MGGLSLPEAPRILVTRTDRIGDLVLSTPVFAELRKKFPKAHIAGLTFRENRAILEGNPFLDEVILYDKKGDEKAWLGNLEFARRLAEKKFDVVVHLHATNRMHLTAWLARIPVRIGWQRKCAWTLTHAYPDRKREGRRHEAEYNFDLLVRLGVRCPEKMRLYFPVSEKSTREAGRLLESFNVPKNLPRILLAPGASCPSKRWAPERFGETALLLSKIYKACFIVVGGKGDKPLAERLVRELPVPIYDLTGEMDLSVLGALLKSSALLISNDSGPVHIAAAVGTPVISVFGRRQAGLSPARWRPLGEASRFLWKDVGCDPCLAHNCRINFLCLDVISPEDVVRETAFLDQRLKAAV